jgi:uncharacterized protein YkwD
VAAAHSKPVPIDRRSDLRAILALALATIAAVVLAGLLIATPAMASGYAPGGQSHGSGKSTASDHARAADGNGHHGKRPSKRGHRHAGASQHKGDRGHGTAARHHPRGHRHGTKRKHPRGVSHTARHGTHAARTRRDAHGRQTPSTTVPETRAASSTSAPTAQPAVCTGAGLAPTPEDLEAVREATLCLINNERITHGERPLQLNADLQNCAQGHSESMAVGDYFSHEGPGGSTPLSRMQAAGYIYSSKIGYEIGENIAWGTLWLATPKAIVESWMQSPEHRANILDASYRETGIGVSPHAPAARAEGEPGALYTQDFGVIITG